MRQAVSGWKESPGRHRSGFRWEVVSGKGLVEGLSEDGGGGLHVGLHPRKGWAGRRRVMVLSGG